MTPEERKNNAYKGEQRVDTQHADAGLDSDEKRTSENYLSFIVNRARKISSALYLVTDTIEEREPLRHELRAASVTLVSTLSTRAGKSFTERRILLEQVEELVERILSFLEIGASSAIISEMNAAILREQLSLFARELSDDRTLLSDRAVLSLDFLKDNNLLKDTHDSKGHKGHPQRESVTDTPANAGQAYESAETGGAGYSHTDTQKTPLHKGYTQKKPASRIGQINERKKRREKIVSFIAKKKDVSIKDITGLFKDIGEKTIQRELAALVSEGAIKKRGEKRWSKYLIAPKKRSTK